jgi:hypothetical protein
MNLSSDFADLLQALNDANARYLIVGAHALAFYARPRATADFDVWVEPSAENAPRVYRALAAFGAPLENLTVEELRGDDLIFQIGIAPLRVDIITGVSGLTFAEAWPHRSEGALDGLRFFVIGRDDLIRNKRASGRAKDLADIERLENDE